MATTYLTEPKTTAAARLNVLILYDLASTATTSTYEHLRSFRLFSRHQVYYAHDLRQIQSQQLFDPFDVVVLHHSLVRPGCAWLPLGAATALEHYQGLKALFLQETRWKQTTAVEWARQHGVELFFTTTPTEHLPLVHPDLWDEQVRCVTVAPRYLPLGVPDRDGRATFDKMVSSFDDAVQASVRHKRHYELSARVLHATDARGKVEALEQPCIYTDPLTLHKQQATTNSTSPAGPLLCQGRLTTRHRVPAPSYEHFQAATLFFTPFCGNLVALFNGSSWDNHVFRETSLVLQEVRDGCNYDVFLGLGDGSDGMLALRLARWADDRIRLTLLGCQDGVFVREDDPCWRYLGTIRGVRDHMTEDSLTRRCVWNQYNQVAKCLYTGDSTVHTYDGAEPRPWNADPGVHFEFVLGQPHEVQLQCNFYLKQPYAAGPGAVVFPRLDDSLEVYPQLQRGLGNYHPNFTGNTVAGQTILDPGYHTIGIGERSSEAGATFAFAWLHGSLRG